MVAVAREWYATNMQFQLYLQKLMPVFANLIFIGFALLFLQSEIIPSYSFISDQTLRVLLLMTGLYIIIAIPYRLMTPLSDKKSKGELALQALGKGIKRFHPRYPLRVHRDDLVITHEEKTALLFILVKFVFLPVMINFLLDHIVALGRHWHSLGFYSTVQSLGGFNSLFFPMAASLIFFVDVLYFTFGYIFEHEKLQNIVRSVEPTFFGWFVTLACYPPFNLATGHVLGWYANDFLFLPNPYITTALGSVGLVLFCIYVWASLALGTKCSNLTNRGIVSRGPYAWVRHPAYFSKNMAWWLTVIPTLNPVAYASMAGWTLLYYLRAYTEERHLLADPDYQAYVKKVPYQFIPKIW